MSMSAFASCWLAAAVVVGTAMPGGMAQTQDVSPVNSGANPYRVIRDWAQLSLEGRPWGGSNGVAIDRDGRSVWATDRCSSGIAPGCLGTKANPIHLFDSVRARRSGVLAAECSCGRTASMSIGTETCG